MQEFFADYGLWLLVALLVIIGLIFLLSGRSKDSAPVPADEVEPSVMAATPPQTIAVEPVAPESVAPPSPVLPIPTTPAVAAPPQAETIVPTAQNIDGDDLLRLKGVGPKLKTQLTALGVTHFAQIAAWTDADIAAVDAQLGAFKGRPIRDQWVDQAKYLARGDIAGFEAKYGKV